MKDFELNDCNYEAVDIVNYIGNYCELDDITIDGFMNRFPHIEISNEKPFKVYKGKYKDEDIVEIIKENIPEDERAAHYCKRLEEELSKRFEEQSKNLIDELLDSLKRMMKDERLSPFDIDKVRRIIDAFKERDFVSLILGRYYHQKRMVVLYKQNIIDTAIDNDIYSNMKRVLAHEMFHAIHHYLFDGAKQVRSKFGKNGHGSIVKEGLARLIEYNYCKDTLNTKLAAKYCSELEESWNNHFFEAYPYSAAKYLEEYTSSHLEKASLIHRLLADSKPDFIDAYHDIIYLYKLSEGFDKVLESDKYKSYKGYYRHYISADKKRYIVECINNKQKYVLGLMTSDIKKEISLNRKDFSNLLYKKINEKKIKNSKCYEDARLNKDAFYKTLRGETDPKPETVAQLAIALKLNSSEYEEFINAAGYARKYKDDDPITIVGVYIDHKEYDWDDIESVFVELTGHTLVNYMGRKETVTLE